MTREENIQKIIKAYKTYWYAIKENTDIEKAKSDYIRVCKGYCDQILNEARNRARKEIEVERRENEQ